VNELHHDLPLRVQRGALLAMWSVWLCVAVFVFWRQEWLAARGFYYVDGTPYEIVLAIPWPIAYLGIRSVLLAPYPETTFGWACWSAVVASAVLAAMALMLSALAFSNSVMRY
jgi:hypothetical protein